MTTKQRNLAKLALENPKLEKKELVALGGYSNSIQHTPAKVLSSKGFLDALDEFGLTEELLTKSLVSDIKAKPKNRKPELELGYKVRGLLNGEDSHKGNTTNIIFLPLELMEKHKLTNGINPSTKTNS